MVKMASKNFFVGARANKREAASVSKVTDDITCYGLTHCEIQSKALEKTENMSFINVLKKMPAGCQARLGLYDGRTVNMKRLAALY